MIECIVGLPGGGKSYWGVERICDYIAGGGLVVTNLPIVGFERDPDGGEGITKYRLREDAPIIQWIREFRGWQYQSGQLRYIDQEQFLGNFVDCVPRGSPRKHVLLVFDEVSDLFDSLDGGRLKSKNDHYRTLFEFLRLHRHYYVDCVILLQDFSTLNARIRGLSEYVHKTVDMQGRRLAGLFFRFPVPMFARFTYDRSGKILLKTAYSPKEKGIFALYDSYSSQGSFELKSAAEKVEFEKPEKGKKKMSKFDRLLLVACVVLVVGVSVWSSARRPAVSVPSGGVSVVVVTNTIERVIDAVADQSVPAAVSTVGRVEREVTCEYQPISWGQAGEEQWAFAGGRCYRLGMSTPRGRVVSLDRWGIRCVSSTGEHWIFHYDLSAPRIDQSFSDQGKSYRVGKRDPDNF